MPTYIFKNRKTEEVFELQMRISELDAYKSDHPDLKQVPTAPNFRLKGTGWYETDFKTKKPGKDDKNGKKDNNDSKQTAGGTTDETGKISKDSPKKAKKQAKISPTKSSS